MKKLLTIMVASLALATKAYSQGALPEMPRKQVDVTRPVVTGVTYRPTTTAELQSAINGSKPGDQILLKGQYGRIYFPRRASCTGYVLLRSDLPDSMRTNLDARVDTVVAGKYYAKLVGSTADPIVTTQPRSCGFWMEQLDIKHSTAVKSPNGAVVLGNTGSLQNSKDSIPRMFVLNQVWVHASLEQQLKRGVTVNADSIAIINSWVDEAHRDGQEAQAIQGHNAFGPMLFRNNYLGGAAQSFLLGGSDPSIANLRTCDVTFTHNYLRKRPIWKTIKIIVSSTTTHYGYTVKNAWELKNACRVYAAFNVMQYNWSDAQEGQTILIKGANQNGHCDWCGTFDVNFAYNRVSMIAGGFNVTGGETYGKYFIVNGDTVWAKALPTARVLVYGNILEKVSAPGDTINQGTGRPFQLGGSYDIVIRRNTIINSPSNGWSGLAMVITPLRNAAVLDSNVAYLRSYNIKAATSGTQESVDSMDKYVHFNLFVGSMPTKLVNSVRVARWSTDNKFFSSWPTSTGSMGAPVGGTVTYEYLWKTVTDTVPTTSTVQVQFKLDSLITHDTTYTRMKDSTYTDTTYVDRQVRDSVATTSGGIPSVMP